MASKPSINASVGEDTYVNLSVAAAATLPNHFIDIERLKQFVRNMDADEESLVEQFKVIFTFMNIHEVSQHTSMLVNPKALCKSIVCRQA